MTAEATFLLKLPLDGGFVADFTPDHSGRLTVLLCMGERNESWGERPRPCAWRVLTLDGPSYTCTEIEPQANNFHFAQPMPDGFLLVKSRSEPGEAGGLLFDQGGRRAGRLVLGDGIQHVQTTRSGDIWVGYSDEGVFGCDPLAGSGLNCFSRDGALLYEFGHEAPDCSIADCYALNVAGEDEIWCYYYSSFELVKLVGRKIVSTWLCPVQGASALAVHGNHVLMQSGYRAQNFQLLSLGESGAMQRIDKVDLVVGHFKIDPQHCVARGSRLWAVDGDAVYGYDLASIDLSSKR